mmetsp:Transcript_1508/g.2096  ORF Transcript_1508/g.2096 Transcript_1508/m.2096 type:complete len:211 (-) Transcript_1508:152-784(-)
MTIGVPSSNEMRRQAYHTFFELKMDFDQFYFHDLHLNPNRAVSIPTFHRILNKSRITLKTIERRHMLCDDAAGLEFMEQLAMIDPMMLVDIDEMKQTPDDFLRKFGWSLEGEKCLKEQIIIGTRAFCAIAAVTPIGFIAFEIFETNISSLEFIHFLHNRLHKQSLAFSFKQLLASESTCSEAMSIILVNASCLAAVFPDKTIPSNSLGNK